MLYLLQQIHKDVCRYQNEMLWTFFGTMTLLCRFVPRSLRGSHFLQCFLAFISSCSILNVAANSISMVCWIDWYVIYDLSLNATFSISSYSFLVAVKFLSLHYSNWKWDIPCLNSWNHPNMVSYEEWEDAKTFDILSKLSFSF